MKEIILIKNGELTLKGLNRASFENTLVKNMKRRLADIGAFQFTKSQSTITLEPQSDGIDLDAAVERLQKVFGIARLSRAAAVPKDMDVILEQSAQYLKDTLELYNTFKVEAKRSDKKFPLKSPEIAAQVGAALLRACPHLKVSMNKPEVTVTVEIREHAAYIHAASLEGAGGIPVGTGGRGAILISGGIDSPVAAWMMAKRGVELTAVHFASPPYTSQLAEDKVMALLQKVAAYSGWIGTYVVPFTEIQEEIQKHCPEDLFTLVMRRYMMKLSYAIAKEQNCQALITGESLGQVASQTIQALACTDAASDLPVFRPCIGMDKNEIVAVARKIDTFDTSIQPYEDCCTVFTPRHPSTKPKLESVIRAEEMIDGPALMERALAGTRKLVIKP